MSAAADRRAVAALIAGACVIGVGPILVRLADAGPAAAGFWRMAFAVPLLLVMPRPAADASGGTPPTVMLAGLFFAADLACWHYGIRLTSVANATVLPNLTPILVAGAAWALFGQKPSPGFVAAMLLAVGGAVIMALARNGGATLGVDGRNPHLGDALSALTSVWYASYFLCVQHARRSASARRVMLVSTAVAAPLLLAVALALREPVLPGAAVGWAACAGLGVMHVAGQGAVAWAMGRLPAALSAVVMLVQPVVAGLLGWLAFGEALSPLQGLGAGVALAGVAFAQVAFTRNAATGQDGSRNGNGRRPFGRRPSIPDEGDAA